MAGAATGRSRSAPTGSPGRAGENLSAALAALAEASGWAARPAFVEAGTAVLAHGEVHDLVARVAGVLADHGVAPGARVLVALADGRWFPVAFLGTVHLGGIAVPVNPGLPEGDHAFLADDADPAVVVCEPGLAARFGGSRPVLEPGDLAAAVAGRDPVPPHPVEGEAIAYAQYTSGTTGRPKAALHRHRDPRCYYRAMGEAALGIRPGDRVLSVSKAYFAYGLGNSVFFPLFSGASAVLWPAKPTPEGAVALARETCPTLFFAVPSFYAALVARAEPGALGPLRAAVSAGEALSPSLLRRAVAWLGCPLLDGLGSTEVGQTFVSNTLDRSRPGTVGVPLPGYGVSVRDDAGSEVAPGETGTLWVRGDSVLAGYWRRPEETEALLAGGWLRTGDRARIDDDGFVHHAGRSDDLEMVGGITVSPLDVEEALGQHPAVAEVAVAAVPDEVGATRLRAFVVPVPGTPGSPTLEAELLGAVGADLAPYKVPRSVRFVDQLPRTPTGKLQRFALRAGWPDAGSGGPSSP